jgi:hypothetical protein
LWAIAESPSSSDEVAHSARAVRDRCSFAGLAVGVLLAGLLVFAGSARAAFPGRNGLLAVQPLRGPGIVLIQADGRGRRRVCAKPADPCAMTSTSRLLRPQWSPDGRKLVLETTADYPWFEVIYPDGSCLDCLSLGLGFGGWTEAAFTSNPTLLTAVTNVSPGGTNREELVEYGVDALERRVLLSGPVSDPVWSSRGELALERGGWIWVGSPGMLRRVTHGSAVSWSPDGRKIVFVQGRWLMAGAVRRRVFRRLARGAAPAWSPDGKSIAFFDTHHRLSLVRATGGKVRRVGGVRGRTVDWQPLPATAPPPCLTPPGATTVAGSETAIITATHANSSYYPFPPGSAVMACLRGDGRERLISSSTSPPYYYVGFGPTQVALAAPYAAFAETVDNTHDQYMVSVINLYDLRTGLIVRHRGGQVATCGSSPPCTSTVDQLVLGSDAVSAVHTTVRDASCPVPPGPNCGNTVEQIEASDSTGVHTLDSASEPDGSPAQLTNLGLTGDTVTWEDNGIPHSAQLQP